MTAIKEFSVEWNGDDYSYNVTNAKVLKYTDDGVVEVDEATQIAVHTEFWRRYGPTARKLQEYRDSL